MEPKTKQRVLFVN